MNKDDIEQLEYIENWKRKQEVKTIIRENKKATIKMHFSRCKAYFKLGFTCLGAGVKAIFRR